MINQHEKKTDSPLRTYQHKIHQEDGIRSFVVRAAWSEDHLPRAEFPVHLAERRWRVRYGGDGIFGDVVKFSDVAGEFDAEGDLVSMAATVGREEVCCCKRNETAKEMQGRDDQHHEEL